MYPWMTVGMPFPTPELFFTCQLRPKHGRLPKTSTPLIPLFLAGNSAPTIPHMFSKRRGSGFPFGCAVSAAVDGRRGSNVYELKLWRL